MNNKKQKALVLASVASMIDQFNMHNIDILSEQGYDVDVIANFNQPGNISEARAKELMKRLEQKKVSVYNIQIPRSLRQVKQIVLAYQQIKDICNKKQYHLVHCHSPIGGVLARLAAKKNRKKGCTVIYTAHGFHFYQGSSVVNWIVFYPIEKICSKWTDLLITINEEDFQCAKKRLYAKDVIRIPGIGVDTEKFYPLEEHKKREKRKELGISIDSYMILSVGELNKNKNQQLIIRAIAELKDSRIHYVLVGMGNNQSELEQLADELGIKEQVHFLGYRTDILELNNAADLFAFPSIREGLPMAPLEALACGTPVCGMNTRGVREYVINSQTGYLFENSVQECKDALVHAMSMRCETACITMAQKYSSEITDEIMKGVYSNVVRGV